MDRSFLARVSIGLAENIVPLAERSTAIGVDITRTPRGVLEKIAIRILDRKTPSSSRRVRDVGPDWLAARELAEPFAIAVFAYARNQPVRKQYQKINSLELFFRFVAELKYTRRTLQTLDSAVFNGYVAWLDRTALSDTSKAKHLGVLRAILSHLRRDVQYRGLLPPDLQIKPNPWPGRSKREKPREGVSIAELVAIERACLKEMAAVMERLAEGERMIIAGRALAAGLTKPIRMPPPQFLLAHIEDHYAGCVRERKQYFADHTGQINAIKKVGGFDVLASWLHATSRNLIPFIVMLAIRTAFNPDTVIRLDRSALKPSPLLGDSIEVDGRDGRHRIVGRKNRAKVDQNPDLSGQQSRPGQSNSYLRKR